MRWRETGWEKQWLPFGPEKSFSVTVISDGRMQPKKQRSVIGVKGSDSENLAVWLWRPLYRSGSLQAEKQIADCYYNDICSAVNRAYQSITILLTNTWQGLWEQWTEIYSDIFLFRLLWYMQCSKSCLFVNYKFVDRHVTILLGTMNGEIFWYISIPFEYKRLHSTTDFCSRSPSSGF